MNANAKPTLMLIDGHSLAFRAFYALSPDSFKTSAGQATNAVHGFISMLLNLLNAEKPTHLAVAFDLSRESFRTKLYPAYKGTRGETPPEFNGQTELIQMALDAMQVKWITVDDFEADDIIATLSKRGDDEGFKVFVVSGDRDTFQLISEDTTVLYPVKGVLNLARMDDAAVVEKYGIHAAQYPDMAALVGETSDNLPGVPGVGPKTAAKWLQQYGSLDAILENAHEIGGKVGESLRENREEAVRNRKLNRLVRDMKLDMSLHDLELKGVDAAKVKETFAKLQFRSLTERVLRLGVIPGTHAEGSTEVEESVVAPVEVWHIPETSSVTWADALKQFQGTTVGCSLGFAPSGIVQIALANRENKVAVAVDDSNRSAIVAWLEDGATKKVIFDSKAVIRHLLGHGVSLKGLEADPLLVAYLLNPVRRGYSLDDLAGEYLGLTIQRTNPDSLLPEDNTDIALDAWLANALVARAWPELEAQNQLKVYQEVEQPSSFALARMEHFGIKVNTEALSAMFDDLTKEVAAAEKKCFDIIGREINLSSPKQLQTVLFDELGMVGNKKVKTGFSTNAASLQALYEEHEHPFLEALLQHREVTKIRQMVEILTKAVDTEGRIHTTYSQTGTSTGRLSSEAPNLQNIPIKSERGRRIRDAFIASPGFETLLTADYSQIEMRIMAHLSGDEGLIQAFNEGEDLHRFVGARIFGVKPEDVTPAMRSKVKAMSYGLVYGLSEYGLAKQLSMSNAEAKQLMADYFDRFGAVRRYLATVVDEAKLNGFTTTVFGRRRPFDDLKSPIFQVRENARRAALNAPIQGTAADIMKLAMIRIDQDMQATGLQSRMLLQVHDELVFEVAPGELEPLKKLVVGHMSQVVKLSVPLDVQVGIGQSWDAAGH